MLDQQKYPEEEYAKALQKHLSKLLQKSFPAASVTCEGAGVHWHCNVVCQDLSCHIACFATGGPEYYISLNRGTESIALGRTSDRNEITKLAEIWIQGNDLASIHAKFEFLDRAKRALIRIEAEAINQFPELGTEVLHEIRQQIADIYELWFRAADRACVIEVVRKNTESNFTFYWQDCWLFATKAANHAEPFRLMKRWLCDYAMPSQIQREFPFVEVGNVAMAYEEGRGVEGEFIQSWDSIERFFMGTDIGGIVAPFIKEMRQRGYDKTLRAGQSMWTLVVSRSRRHGLRPRQPYIAFYFEKDGTMKVSALIDQKSELPNLQARLGSDVEQLLQHLLSIAIK